MATFLTTDDEEEELASLRDDTHEAISGRVTIRYPKKKEDPEPEPPKPDKPPKKPDDEEDDEDDQDQALPVESQPELPATEAPTAEVPTEATAQTSVAELSEQQRIDNIASTIRGFRTIMSGGASLLGGFGRVPYNGVTMAHLEKSFAEFKLVGTDGVQAHGSLEKGYVLSGNPQEQAAVEGFPFPVPPPPPPPTPTGACCDGEDCTITTEAECTGVYQGDDTVCDPNPCVACCSPLQSNFLCNGLEYSHWKWTVVADPETDCSEIGSSDRHYDLIDEANGCTFQSSLQTLYKPFNLDDGALIYDGTYYDTATFNFIDCDGLVSEISYGPNTYHNCYQDPVFPDTMTCDEGEHLFTLTYPGAHEGDYWEVEHYDVCECVGACCQAPETCEDTSCNTISEDDCTDAGGIYAGDGTVCTTCPPRSSITITFAGITDCGCVSSFIPDVSDANITFTLDYTGCLGSGTDTWDSDSISFSKTDCFGTPIADGHMTAHFTCSPCNDEFGHAVIQLNVDGEGWSFYVSSAFPLINGDTYSNSLTCAFSGHTQLGTATISW